MVELIELKLATQAREIRALAPELANEKKTHDEAIRAERKAESTFLAQVAEMAKPALPAIASRIEFFPGHFGVLLLDGWKTEGRLDVRGRRVYLLEDGSFAETWRSLDATAEEHKKGACSTCVKAGSTETIIYPGRPGVYVKFRSYSSASCIVSSHDPKPLISGLHAEMKRQHGKRVACIIEAQKSAAKLNAIMTLLG